MKPKLLYLVHRIPYPPNKGDKIRSFNWLNGLSDKYDIYLGTFVDNNEDKQYIRELRKYCTSVFVEKFNPKVAKIRSLSGLLSGQALTLPYYRNANLQSWVDFVVQENNISLALIFSSSMAQYVDGEKYTSVKRVMDFVDIDSDKWKQYSEKKSGIMKWIYSREAIKLLDYEKQVCEKFDSSLFVSSKESEMFSRLISSGKDKVDFVNNGVDVQYFSPNNNYENPYESNGPILVFTGAMDYWANIDAVVWFSKEIYPIVKQQFPDLQFYIVGSGATAEVLALQGIEGIEVTGRVDDVRPYVYYSNIAVAPMRIARGVQNKVLEAMALAKECIVSPQGLEGIEAKPGEQIMLANNNEEWLGHISNLLIEHKQNNLGRDSRQFVSAQFSWKNNITKLENIIGCDSSAEKYDELSN